MESEHPHQGKVLPVTLVAGATGRAGKCIVKELLQHGHRVRILTRNQEKGLALFGYTVEIEEVKDLSIKGPRSDLANAAIWEDVETIVTALGPADNTTKGMEYGIYGASLNLITHAFSRGIRTYVCVSSAGCTKAYNPEAMWRNLIGRMELHWHAKTEKALAVSGVHYIVIRPTSLIDTKHGTVPEGVVITQGDKPTGGKISTSALAAVVVKSLSLRSPNDTESVVSSFNAANQYYRPHIPSRVAFEVSGTKGVLDTHKLEQSITGLSPSSGSPSDVDHFSAALYTKVIIVIIFVFLLLLLFKTIV